jgi:thioredoxin-dependent peroxiredoxin
MADDEMPAPGQRAPEFTGTTGAGTSLSLDDFRGQWLLLYFYPRDNTSGCTRQACNLRDNFGALRESGIAVVGVSDDPPEKHAGFSEKYELPSPLIADTDRKVLQAYGAYGEKNMYGIKRMGTKRTSFLIDPDGVIRHVFKRPKTGEHAEEVMGKVESIK